MSELNITNIPAPRVALIDDRTGLMSREWYRFFMNLFVLTGSGQSDISVTDLAVQPVVQATESTIPNLGAETQLASMMARYDDAMSAIQGAYLQPVPVATFQFDPLSYCAPSQAASMFAVSGVPSSGQIVRYNGGPAWSTTTWPNTLTVSQVLYSSGTNAVGSSANFTFDGTNVAVANNSMFGASSAPGAKVHIAAGTASAGTGQLLLDASTLLSSAVAGMVERTTDSLYYTIATGTSRKEITLSDSSLTANVIPMATTNGRLKDSSGAAAMAIGTTPNVNQQLRIGGTFAGSTNASGIIFASTLTPPVGGGSTSLAVTPTVTPAASGTHATLLGLNVVPTFTSGLGSSVTDAVSVQMSGVAAPSNTTNNSALKILAAPTGATNNYSIWVTAGKSKFDGAMEFGTHSAITAETLTGYITITDNGGTTRKLAVVS